MGHLEKGVTSKSTTSKMDHFYQTDRLFCWPYFVQKISDFLFCTIFGFWNNKLRGSLLYM